MRIRNLNVTVGRSPGLQGLGLYGGWRQWSACLARYGQQKWASHPFQETCAQIVMMMGCSRERHGEWSGYWYFTHSSCVFGLFFGGICYISCIFPVLSVLLKMWNWMGDVSLEDRGGGRVSVLEPNWVPLCTNSPESRGRRLVAQRFWFEPQDEGFLQEKTHDSDAWHGPVLI